MQKKNSLKGFLLISDIDGTFIDYRHQVPSRNLKAVERFTKKGGLFAFATGRARSSVRKFARDAGVNAPCILVNGASICRLSTGERLWEACLPKEAGKLLAQARLHFPNVGIEVYSGNEMCILQENAWLSRGPHDKELEKQLLRPGGIANKWNKLVFSGESDELAKAEAFLKKLPNRGWDFVYSGPRYFEALPHGVDKGFAMIKLAKLLNICHTNIMAIGDYDNDFGLVSRAAFSAAPDGATENIKKAADVTVGLCETGAVADFIEAIEKKYA